MDERLAIRTSEPNLNKCTLCHFEAVKVQFGTVRIVCATCSLQLEFFGLYSIQQVSTLGQRNDGYLVMHEDASHHLTFL